MGLSTIHVGDIEYDIEYDIEWDSLWCHQTLENNQKFIKMDPFPRTQPEVSNSWISWGYP